MSARIPITIKMHFSLKQYFYKKTPCEHPQGIPSYSLSYTLPLYPSNPTPSQSTYEFP